MPIRTDDNIIAAADGGAALVAFLVRRTLMSALLLLAFSFVSFCLFAAKFNPLRGHPVLPAYWLWLRGVPSGHSLSRGLFGPIWPTLLPSLGHTLVLLALTLALVVAFAAAIGTVAAARSGSVLDGLLRLFMYVAWGVPAFLLAFLVQEAINGLGTSHGLGPFPLAGWPGSCPTGFGLNAGVVTPCPAAGTGIQYVANVLRYLTLPALTLACGFVGLHARYLRVRRVSPRRGSSFVTRFATRSARSSPRCFPTSGLSSAPPWSSTGSSSSAGSVRCSSWRQTRTSPASMPTRSRRCCWSPGCCYSFPRF
jgi:hypothetical protein